MGSVWKRLQRVNKRAAKFQFTSSYHELHVETTAKWRPSNLSVVWTRRSRRVASTPLPWEPDMMNPLVGHITWPVPDNHAISVTLFKDPRTHELEDKDWTFVIEDITPMGKKRVLASTCINMRKYASIESTQQSFTLKLKPTSRKITSADLELTISCVLLREGKATDEDMQSVVSLMSVNNNCDVAPLDDLEDIPDLESTGDISDHLFDFTQQLEQLTSSLNGCNDLPTPLSVPSLSEDPTPLAEVNSFKFEPELDKQGPQLANEMNEDDNNEDEESLKTPSAMRTMLMEPADLKSSMMLGVSEKEKYIATPTTKLTMTPTTTTTTASSEMKLKTAKSKMYTSTPLSSKVMMATTTTPPSTANDGSNTVGTKARRSIDFNQDSSLQGNNNNNNTTTLATTTIDDDGDMLVPKEKIISKTNGGTTAASVMAASVTAASTSASKDSTTTRGQAGQRTMDATIVGPQAMITKTTSKLTTPPTTTTTATATSTATTTTTTSTARMESRLENGDDGGGSGVGGGNSASPDRRKQLLLQRSDQKRAELLPLNLKKSYDHDGGIENNAAAPTTTTTTKPVEKIILKENTPGQDLLEWCKDVTREYPNVKVTNLTTSWRNGMAFCAIIHHFEPHLVDMEKLSSHDVVGNCRTAFDAAETLGIPRVIEPRDMSLLAVPDKLAVMTYLHQLRAHFTGKQLQIEQIGPTSDESSYVIGNYKSDNLSQNLLNLSHLKTHLLHQNSLDDDIYGVERSISVTAAPLSPATKKDVKNLILAGSKSILGKVLSPAKDKNAINVTQHALMPPSASHHPVVEQNKVVAVVAAATAAAAAGDQKKVNNNNSSSGGGGGGGGGEHFVDAKSDIDGLEISTMVAGMRDEQTVNHHHHHHHHHHHQQQQQQQQQRPTSPNSLEPMAANKILSRHKEMSERAKMMMEKLKLSNGERNESDEERQQRLREQARRLILETRTKATNGSHHNLESPTSPTKLKRMNFSPERTISPIQNGIDNNTGSHSPTKMVPTKKITPPRDGDTTTTTTTTTTTMSLNNSKQSPSHRLSERYNNNSSNSPLQSFNSVMERISPKNDKKVDKMSYIESELEALEREQEAIDQKASSLEKKLRAVMGGNPKTEETEEQLLSQWFTLVNKKNALLRRQMQLNILEQESDLERRYTMLNKELRAAQSVEDWRKTEAQREKERLLLEELVAIVDKRDQLVQRLHNQEIAIEDDHEIARELEQVDISGGREKCCIQ